MHVQSQESHCNTGHLVKAIMAQKKQISEMISQGREVDLRDVLYG